MAAWSNLPPKLPGPTGRRADRWLCACCWPAAWPLRLADMAQSVPATFELYPTLPSQIAVPIGQMAKDTAGTDKAKNTIVVPLPERS